MSRIQKSVVSPGLVNLIIIEFLFLLVAVFTGIYIWVGMPALTPDTGLDIFITLIVMTFLSFIHKCSL